MDFDSIPFFFLKTDFYMFYQYFINSIVQKTQFKFKLSLLNMSSQAPQPVAEKMHVNEPPGEDDVQ